MTPSTAHLFCAEDPQRPADWRWARAQWLTSQRSRYARQKDEEDVVLVARSYQKLLANCRSDTDHDALRRKYPGIYWAHRIHETSSGVRWALEAWLLTGAPPALIVQRNRVTPETLTWYEKLFFSVTDSLACPDYILNVVIGSAVHRGVNDRDYDLLWKLFGFLGGVDVLDSMITQKANPRAEAWFGDHTRFTIRRKAAIAAHTMPVAFHHQVILETYTKVAELERLHGNTEESHNLMVKQLHLGAFFRKQAESEMGHVLQFAHKIRASGGVPVNPPAFSFAPYTTGKLLLQYAIEMEQEVVANYHRRLKEFERLEEETGRHHDLVMFIEEQIEDSQSDVDEMLQIARGL
jgi:bacterioferritin (cytochrome b1)